MSSYSFNWDPGAPPGGSNRYRDFYKGFAGGAPFGLGVGFLRGLSGMFGGHRRAKRAKRRYKRRLWAAEDLGRIARTEGWGPEMEPLFQALAGRSMSPRMLQQQADFYGRPGAYKTLEYLKSLIGLERPDFYGDDFGRALSSTTQAGYAAQAEATRDAAERRLATTGGDPSLLSALDAKLAQAQAETNAKNLEQLTGIRQQDWDKAFTEKANLLAILSNFINMQSNLPMVLEQKKPDRYAQWAAILGPILQGAGSMIGAL